MLARFLLSKNRALSGQVISNYFYLSILLIKLETFSS